jgi:phospholipid/cholesterol/gamma-HCH transport system permease protein
LQTDSLVTVTSRDEGLVLTAKGSWTASNAGDLERSLAALLPPGDRSLVIEAGGVREFDTYGAWLLERVARSRPDTRILGLHGDYQDLFAKVRGTNRQSGQAGAAAGSAAQAVARLGRSMVDLATGFLALLAMIGALTESLLRAILRPLSFRLTSLVQQLDRTAWQAVPIILLITFLIGCIISQQAIFHFRKFGAEDYVVDLVGILVLREIGVLIVAIMVAGRSGSSYTAELGSMKMREEIDALRTMGRDPIDVLVLPRVLALVIALPILALLGSLAALLGAGLVSWIYGGIDPTGFLARLREAVSLSDFQVGMTKAPFMAFMIGAVAASEGFKVAGSTESLGLRTTSSVVQSIFLVIVLDGVFAIFFAALGL